MSSFERCFYVNLNQEAEKHHASVLASQARTNFCTHTFTTKDQESGIVEWVNDPLEVDEETAKNVLIDSFIFNYRESFSPCQIDPKLKHWFSMEGEPSVEGYYARYFDTEFTHFKKGNLFWVQALVEQNLAGWMTFRQEPELKNSLYLNTLVVDPLYEKKGIGKQLVYSMLKLKILPEIKVINLFLRTRNEGGKRFFSQLGFRPNPHYHLSSYRTERWVDKSLTESWSLELRA